MFRLLSKLLLINIIERFAYGEIAFLGRQPIAINPTLYDSENDSVIQLDVLTFNETIFCEHSSSDDCTAFVVNANWCGHCRKYSQIYKSLARDIQGWSKVVRIAAINCADPINEIICHINGILYFPQLKYFPHNSSSPQDGKVIQSSLSVADLRDLITQMILNDFYANRPPNWPNFDFLNNIRTYDELWQYVNQSVPLLVIIFEEIGSNVGAEV
ncbi:unnamed protein product [Onchocerca ochengi]|uniref:Thioredoxin domain-containing protein n=1 Tax=Onchocerca ochengi TaxID=42157 RepID=A0A182ETS0_ONCOC|nr:unnamed protein product [Onchocerca ochengi]